MRKLDLVLFVAYAWAAAMNAATLSVVGYVLGVFLTYIACQQWERVVNPPPPPKPPPPISELEAIPVGFEVWETNESVGQAHHIRMFPFKRAAERYARVANARKTSYAYRWVVARNEVPGHVVWDQIRADKNAFAAIFSSVFFWTTRWVVEPYHNELRPIPEPSDDEHC